MKLKNDIQVKAFLIRNKIPFEKWETFLLIDDTKIGQATRSMLTPYEFTDESLVPMKRRAKGSGKYHYIKKPKKNELPLTLPAIKIFFEQTEVKQITREKGNYSNTQWNEL